jgi:hypothetical protein
MSDNEDYSYLDKDEDEGGDDGGGDEEEEYNYGSDYNEDGKKSVLLFVEGREI